MEQTEEKYIKDYPFLNYINENKSHYKHAKDCGYNDPDDLFLIGESGGFLLNIQPGDKFINTHLFTEAADSFRKNGRYTMYAPGTFKNKQFWTREWDRCCNGCTIGKYRLTGQNYFWLNYYRLESNISAEASDDQVRVEDFPGFLAKQYEYFHYLELVKLLKKDALVFKARVVN